MAVQPIRKKDTRKGYNPNAPTRASKFYERDLRKHVNDYSRRLPDRGGFLPFHGYVPTLPDGTPGGVARGPLPVNATIADVPIVRVPRGTAQRGEALRRQIRRTRLSRESIHVLLRPGPSGYDYASGPRIRPRTPSVIRGALRDIRSYDGNADVLYGQTIAPAQVSANLVHERQAALGVTRFQAGASQAPIDRVAGAEQDLALRHVLGTSSVLSTTVNDEDADESKRRQQTTMLALLAVVAVGFVVLKTRG